MTAITPPTFLQAGSYDARPLRIVNAALLGDRGGPLGYNDLLVEAQSTPNMTVKVAEGRVAIPGSESIYQGTYIGEVQGSTNVTITAANPSNPRYTIIVARVNDAAYSGALNSFTLEAIDGVAGAAPALPATPANCWVLAYIYVGTGVTSITSGNVFDTRRGGSSYPGQYGAATALGGVSVGTSATRPTLTTADTGFSMWETDTSKMVTWTGSAWRYPDAFGRLGVSTMSANSAAFTTIIYPLSVTVAPLPNRLLRVSIDTNVYSTTAGCAISVSVCNNAGTIITQNYRNVSTGSQNEQVSVDFYTTSGAGGSTTWKIGAFASGGTGFLVASGTSITTISVHDEGPS